ncbi:class I SAM-dependent methyltransferase [Hyphobacterium sp. HN65]|uniref:Class I SAM-dependent methyltransferase n=1 Tax=Hyphobacterium lacteum TaxID=3116575 RepID=A0ABU7LRJ7_9PROT|nr:class I SAM-dependent methyltransferase [Hyphobacterium sp. HN65]MEE2526261.1 class I SAM-dependent methyltransferase [Hyphobacterium sp. HN65]
MIDPQSVKGFLDPGEGAALCRYAAPMAEKGPFLEIGGYCGKSALYLGATARDSGTHLFSIDHHRGSEEHQPGEGYFDPELYDGIAGAVDTLPSFRRNVLAAGLEPHVIALVGKSSDIARYWTTPLGFVFIDGGHSMEAAQADYDGWAPKVAPGGILAIHDVFPNPEDGGRPPYEIWKQAVESGHFEPVERVRTLEVLRRVDPA